MLREAQGFGIGKTNRLATLLTKNPSEQIEEDNRKNSAHWQGNNPGQEYLAHNTQVQGTYAACHADAQYGANKCMSCGYGYASA